MENNMVVLSDNERSWLMDQIALAAVKALASNENWEPKFIAQRAYDIADAVLDERDSRLAMRYTLPYTKSNPNASA
jgi:hypothetical protein